MTFSKNQKNPFLDSGQIDVDSNLQGCRPISVVMRPFTSSKIAILAVFLGKNHFFRKPKIPFLGYGQSDVDSNFQGCRPKSMVMRPFMSSKIAILAVFF